MITSSSTKEQPPVETQSESVSEINVENKTESLPANVIVGTGTRIQSEKRCFARFQSLLDPALTIGERCILDYVHFALGPSGRVSIGDYCCLNSVILLCEAEITIGSYVMVGWNTTIADSDFHPIDPARRIEDAIACSPMGNAQNRPPIEKRPVTIEDNAWIGPNVTILKGVTIGSGAWVEPGSLVVRDVAPGDRIMGNPARVVEEEIRS